MQPPNVLQGKKNKAPDQSLLLACFDSITKHVGTPSYTQDALYDSGQHHAHLAAMAVGCGGVTTLITQLFADGVLRKVISSGEVNKHTVSVAVKSLPGV